MRVVIVSQFYEPEPAGLQGDIARFMAGLGHDVQVLTGFPNYPGGKTYHGYRIRLLSRERVEGVRVCRVPLYPSHDASGTRRMLNYMSFAAALSVAAPVIMRDADVIYVYHPPGTVPFIVALYGRLLGKPVLVHVQDIWPDSVVNSGMVKGKYIARALRWVLDGMCTLTYAWSTRLAVISPGFKRLLAERGVDPTMIDVVPNWADERFFRPGSPDEELRRSLGLVGRFVVMFAGNLGEFQGLDVAIRAASAVRHLEGFRLVLMGQGSAEPALRSLAKSLGASNVIFHKRVPQSEIQRFGRLADVQLVSLKDLPFFASTIPGKTQSIMASGQPIIMAVRGDAARIVEDAGAGFVCEPGNERALADAFGQAYANRGTALEEMGANARRYYHDHLSFSHASQYFEATCVAIAGAGKSEPKQIKAAGPG